MEVVDEHTTITKRSTSSSGKYAEFIDATPAFVVAESLKLLFNKDAEFRQWLTQHGDKVTRARAEQVAPQEQTQVRPGVRTMFDEVPQRAPTK